MRFRFSAPVGSFLILALSACSHNSTENGWRDPSSSRPGAAIPFGSDLADATSRFRQLVSSERFQGETCASLLQEIYTQVYQLDGSQFDREKALRDFDPIIKNLWETKIALRHRLKEFLEKGKLSRPCIDASRNILRAGRYLEDYLGYLHLKEPVSDPDHPLEAYKGGFPYLMVNADAQSYGFQSGDILLSRGTAFTSSAIARIGDVDGQFSHLAILYIDENTKKTYTVEAHIEVGVKVFPLEDYLKDGKARALLFRYHDKELAHLAAKRMFELAKRISATGENIPYDFTMKTDTKDSLFCSEVVQYGFEMAGKELGRTLSLPLYSTGINMRNTSFMDAIGVQARETFAPADIEVDPRVELIAEWRDYSRVRLLHRHDAVLTKIYEWMEDRDYVLQGDPINWLKKNIVWSMRRWPLFSDLLKEKFPKNMSANMLGTISKLNSAAGAMFDELVKADLAYEKRTGLPMAPKNMEAFLEKLREKDLSAYRARRECRSNSSRVSDGCNGPLPKFHWDFRARNEP